MGVNGDAAPIVVCNTTGCTIGNAYAFWPDRVPCHVISFLLSFLYRLCLNVVELLPFHVMLFTDWVLKTWIHVVGL